MTLEESKKWFKNAGQGLMIHWGLYSLLAGEYRGKRMDYIGEWIMSKFQIPNAEYEKLAKNYGLEADKIKNFIPSDEIAKDVAMQKAIDFVRDNAEITKKAARKPAAKKSAAADGEAEKKPAAKKTTTAKKTTSTAAKKTTTTKKTTAKKDAE